MTLLSIYPAAHLIFTRLRIGRRTRQYNPSLGAKSLGQWLTAVMSMKGESDAMSVPVAVEMIRATPPTKRSEFAREIWGEETGEGDGPGGTVLTCFRCYAPSVLPVSPKRPNHSIRVMHDGLLSGTGVAATLS
jgi:hypothetical protein